MAKKKFKIMILDDDKALVRVLAAHLADYETVGLTDESEALERLRTEEFDLLILDYLLTDSNGEVVVKKIREFNQNLYILLLTGCGPNTLEPMEALKEWDIQFYCEKSADIERTMLIIESAIKSIVFLRGKRVSFADRLKEMRARHGHSQEQLAQMVGVKRSAVANWEQGGEVTLENLKRLCAIYRVSMDYMIGNIF
ncbi:helix-turn-helix domain-containing protein [Azotosporobacter soli]|uniref:helix-turn-helix domain-containing protein n=1 Tax=Azotosporobacter soli TaxID=3055040 RepID=UPI0031FF456D